MGSLDFTRGLGTYIQSESPVLGIADALFGSDPDSPDNDINRDTFAAQEGFNSNVAEQVGNKSALTTGQTNALTGTTALSDTSTANTGLQSQTGTQGVGQFTGQTGFGTSGYDPTTGAFTSNLSAPYQQNVNQALGASNQAYGALSAQDFNGTMGQRYNALEALQEQDRLQAQMNMEDRLYSQGRLGSTGGALQQNALLDAIGQQQLNNQNTAFGQAMAQRQQFGDQAIQFGQGALQPQQLSIQQLQAMGALAPQVSQNDISTNNLSNFTGLNDTTGFQDANTSHTLNSSEQNLAQQLGYNQKQAVEGIRTVDDDDSMPGLNSGTPSPPGVNNGPIGFDQLAGML